MSEVETIRDKQVQALRDLCQALVPDNRFYAERLTATGLDLARMTLEDFTAKMPLTTRAQWTKDQVDHPPYGTNLTYPLDRYVRFCRTSGSTGRPMVWLDTRETWDALLDNWIRVFQAAGVTTPQMVALGVLFVVVGSSTVVAVAAIGTFSDHSEELLARLRRWLTIRSRAVITTILLAVGALLTIRGVAGLL